MKYHADGPVVMLGDSTSVFPAQLAACWRSKGMEVVLITHRPHGVSALPDGIRVVHSSEYATRVTRAITGRIVSPVLSRMERLVPRFKHRFTRLTGVSADTELWLPYFAEYVAAAWPTVRAARAQRPRFVFGHEVTTYGLPTALCRGVPRIIFPWGGDVFTYAESSPFHFALTSFCLRAADLIVPSSTTAARHISQRFNVSPERVKAVSWGVDRRKFKRAEGEQRRIVCAKWKIDPAATIVLNPRRFRPDWGAFLSLEAFIQIASEHSDTHFIIFGGRDTEKFTGEAQTQISGKGLSSRFTVLEGEASLDVCAELMSVADVLVSLLGRGDMRSASVLQAAAAGAAPIIADTPEYRELERSGFRALFVAPGNVEDVINALRVYVNDPVKAQAFVAQNDEYLAAHEDYGTQMDLMLRLIGDVCARYQC
jgi:glycosyltransferase involved in cell wall biosynthesis